MDNPENGQFREIIGLNGLLMTLFTPEDLLLYLYNEAPPSLVAAIETAIAQDWTLQEKIEVLQASISRLDEALESPRTEAVLNVLNYARETEAVTH